MTDTSGSRRLSLQLIEPRHTLATHFVDPQIGDDSQTTGSIEAPFATILWANQLIQAGDAVYLRESVYREQVSVPRSGSAVESFAGADGNGCGKIDAADPRLWQRYFGTRCSHQPDLQVGQGKLRNRG